MSVDAEFLALVGAGGSAGTAEHCLGAAPVAPGRVRAPVQLDSPVTQPIKLRRQVLPFVHSPGGTPQNEHSWNGRDRRSSDHIKRLSREFDALCTLAVDSAEIAAGLESVGFTDGTAREYRCGDVFALADRMFLMTPRLVNKQPGRLANPWAERPLRHLTRGVSFALPGLIFVACLPHTSSAMDFPALTVAMLLGWPIGQTMAFIGHSLEGRRHPMAARALLVLAMAGAIVLGTAFGLAARAVGTSTPIALVGGGEIVYMAAAAVILVFSNELIVIATLVPGLAVAGLGLWLPAITTADQAAAAGVTVMSAVAAAVVVCGRARMQDVRVGFQALNSKDWTEAGFHSAYGVSGGVLVTLPAISGFGTAIGSLSLLPVIWSMGSAEWNIVRLRRRSFDMLNQAISVRYFQDQVGGLVVRNLSRYLVDLTLLTLALVSAVWVLRGSAPSAGVVIGLAASWMLGCSFYLALVLSSLGRMRVVVVAMVAAIGLGILGIQLFGWEAMILVAPIALSVLLFPSLKLSIGDPTRHM